MVAWRGTAACHAERRPKWPRSLPVLGAALVPFGWLSVLPRSDLALREHGLMNASDARSDVPPTRPLHQQAQPSPSRSVCCPACPLSRELPPGSQPRGNGFGLFSLTGTQDEARAYAARRREGGPREELSTDDLHRSAGERVRRARYCGVGTPADCGRRAVPHKNWTKTACRSPGSGAPRSVFGSSGRAGYSPANRWC